MRKTIRFIDRWFLALCLLFTFFMVSGGAFLVHNAVDNFVRPSLVALQMIGVCKMWAGDVAPWLYVPNGYGRTSLTPIKQALSPFVEREDLKAPFRHGHTWDSRQGKTPRPLLFIDQMFYPSLPVQIKPMPFCQS